MSAMKAQAWERAKGEIQSISAADYPPENATKEEYALWLERGEKRRQFVAAFFKAIEDEELHR